MSTRGENEVKEKRGEERKGRGRRQGRGRTKSVHKLMFVSERDGSCVLDLISYKINKYS